MQVREITESKQQLDEWFFVPAMLLGAAKFIATTAAIGGVVVGVPMARQWLSTLEANNWQPPKGFMPDKTQITLDKTHKDFPGRAIWSDSKQQWSLEKEQNGKWVAADSIKQPIVKTPSVKTPSLPSSVDINPGLLVNGYKTFNVVDQDGNVIKRFNGPSAEANANTHRDELKKTIEKEKTKVKPKVKRKVKFVLGEDAIKKAFATKTVVFNDRISLLRKISEHADTLTPGNNKTKKFKVSGQNLKEKIRFEEGKAGGIVKKTIAVASQIAGPLLKVVGWAMPAYILIDAYILRYHYIWKLNGGDNYKKGKYPLGDGETYTSAKYDRDIVELKAILQTAIAAYLFWIGGAAIVKGLVTLFWRVPKFAVGFNKKTAIEFANPRKKISLAWNAIKLSILAGGGYAAFAQPDMVNGIAKQFADILMKRELLGSDGKAAAERLINYLANALMGDEEFYRKFLIMTGWGSDNDNKNQKLKKQAGGSWKDKSEVKPEVGGSWKDKSEVGGSWKDKSEVKPEVGGSSSSSKFYKGMPLDVPAW
jgi:hypothetical protein